MIRDPNKLYGLAALPLLCFGWGQVARKISLSETPCAEMGSGVGDGAVALSNL